MLFPVSAYGVALVPVSPQVLWYRARRSSWLEIAQGFEAGKSTLPPKQTAAPADAPLPTPPADAAPPLSRSSNTHTTMVRTKAVAKKSSAAGRAWLKEQQQQKLKWASTENDDDSQWSMRGMTLDLGPKFLIGKDVFTNPKSLVAKPSARGLRPGGLADHVLWAKVGSLARRGTCRCGQDGCSPAWLLTPPRTHPSQLRPPSLSPFSPRTRPAR